ncbi:hypothetical protein [Myroides fluvii]|uniref:hypothetical protein n=1 Tax=Myroides fluvii TaxID=2572594 RepID=UPI00131BC435|nr:hypothetical protein [Myroides fluvii]
MRKKILAVALVALGLSTVSCSSDDSSSSKQYKKEIQGEWIEVETLYLDENRRVVSTEKASDNEGCGFDEVEFKENKMIVKMPFRSVKDANCHVELIENRFTLTDRTILVQIKNEEEIELIKNKIIQVDESTLVLEYANTGDESQEGITYVQTKHTKKQIAQE